jgi:hypothetical protein
VQKKNDLEENMLNRNIQCCAHTFEDEVDVVGITGLSRLGLSFLCFLYYLFRPGCDMGLLYCRIGVFVGIGIVAD